MTKHFCDICKKEVCFKDLKQVSLPVFDVSSDVHYHYHNSQNEDYKDTMLTCSGTGFPEGAGKVFKKIDMCDDCLTKCARDLYTLGIRA